MVWLKRFRTLSCGKIRFQFNFSFRIDYHIIFRLSLIWCRIRSWISNLKVAKLQGNLKPQHFHQHASQLVWGSSEKTGYGLHQTVTITKELSLIHLSRPQFPKNSALSSYVYWQTAFIFYWFYQPTKAASWPAFHAGQICAIYYIPCALRLKVIMWCHFKVIEASNEMLNFLGHCHCNLWKSFVQVKWFI